MNTLTKLLAPALFATTMSAQALDVQYQDPAPGVGISYEFEVHMNHGDTAVLVGSVGAKSSYEPEFEAPDIGWTHTSNWIALMIHQPSLVTFNVTNQGGVVVPKVSGEDGSVSYSMAGGDLYPGLSIYSGWDDTTETEKGSFNSIGNFWSTIEWIESEGDMQGSHSLSHSVILGPGLYSINIGGVNAMHCGTEEPCFNGRHGYVAEITADKVPTSYGAMEGGMHSGGM